MYDFKEVDVAVVGAGPAGATAALTLARQGVRVLMVSRPDGRGVRVGEGLPPAARPLLQALGLWERFVAAGHLPSYSNRSAWGTAELLDADFVFNPYGHGWRLDRAAFDALLATAVIEAGGRPCQATRLLGWAPGAPHGVLRLQQANRELAVRARYVIDCSGRAAVIGTGCGARRIQHDKLVAAVALHRPTRGGDRDGSTLVEAVANGWWYTALLPDGARVFVHLTDGDLLNRESCRDTAAWRALLDRTEHIRQANERFGYEPAALPMIAPATSSRLTPAAGEGWVAAGDAALSFDPLSSQGILTAMTTGRAAAAAVLASLAGDEDAFVKYTAQIQERDREYLARRDHYYALEGRWPHSVFWKRRSRQTEAPFFQACRRPTRSPAKRCQRVGELIMDLKQVELRHKTVTENLKALADDKDFAELLTIIHRPGWTTPAETMFVNGLLDSMIAHTKHITDLKQTLLAGARAVSPK